MEMFQFKGIVLKDLGGYASLCPELDVASMGQTVEEAKKTLLEAATLHIEGALRMACRMCDQSHPGKIRGTLHLGRWSRSSASRSMSP